MIRKNVFLIKRSSCVWDFVYCYTEFRYTICNLKIDIKLAGTCALIYFNKKNSCASLILLSELCIVQRRKNPSPNNIHTPNDPTCRID